MKSKKEGIVLSDKVKTERGLGGGMGQRKTFEEGGKGRRSRKRGKRKR